jgi:hypothetical protein
LFANINGTLNHDGCIDLGLIELVISTVLFVNWAKYISGNITLQRAASVQQA